MWWAVYGGTMNGTGWEVSKPNKTVIKHSISCIINYTCASSATAR
jgi:hypothetical protein